MVLLAGLPAGAARAESAADARARAMAAAGRVEALRPAAERALRAYDRALAGLASGVTASLSAEQAADEAERLAVSDQRAVDSRVRTLYMSGGPPALVVSVLSAGTATDALRRASYVRRLVRAGTADAVASADHGAGLRLRARSLQRAAERSTVTATEVEARYADLLGLLAAAAAELDQLDARARGLEAAEKAAAHVDALNAAVTAAGQQRVATARASEVVPLVYRRLYGAAARTCPGMSWTLLAAVGQVETGHGANTSSSYAGAQGPMQFMPATFAAYGVDGDGDGDTDIRDPADAVFSAANYLCANGAGRSPEATARAVWHYNHADWYVALVLKLAEQYARR